MDFGSSSLLPTGINADTGGYGFPAMPVKAFAKVVSGTQLDPGETDELKKWLTAKQQRPYGIAAGHDVRKLEESGWGVIFPHDCDPAVMDALRPLLEWRKSQAARDHEHYYQEYSGEAGYLPGDTRTGWLFRPPRGTAFGPVNPDKVPYYLLIVGSPAVIPYTFQIQLDVAQAVGRICFNTPEEYARYAESVVKAEQQHLCLPRTACFFGPQNADDRSTLDMTSNLLSPLASSFTDSLPFNTPRWQVEKLLREQATKARLGQIFAQAAPPALLFTASHGMEFGRSSPERQLRQQGALLCQDWPGPMTWGARPVPEDFFFSASDLDSSANLWGSIAFFYACYGLGTPRLDEFIELAKSGDGVLAEQPFVAGLPQRMLSHPRGGALAVIGHVDRAWGCSYQWGGSPQLQVFTDLFYRLVDGYPLGAAFDVFNDRYSQLSSELIERLQAARQGIPVASSDLAGLWTATNDAKNYLIFGDPAVRLMV